MTAREEWRPVIGFLGLYEVSNLGAVRSLQRAVPTAGGTRTIKGRVLRSYAGPYPAVSLRKNGHSYKLKIHSLVLSAFVGPRPDGMETRHLDGDKTNAALSNLCYGTVEENTADKRRHGTILCGADSPVSKLSPDDVRSIRELLRCGGSYRSVADRFGISTWNIQMIVTRKTWSWLA